MVGRLVVGRKNKLLGSNPVRAGDAERRRSRRCGTRSVANRLVDLHVYRFTGAAVDDPQHVQDRRRVDPDGLSRGGKDGGDPRSIDLLRSQRRHGCSANRVCTAGITKPAAGDGHGPHRASGDAAQPSAVRALLRRVPHIPRTVKGRSPNG